MSSRRSITNESLYQAVSQDPEAEHRLSLSIDGIAEDVGDELEFEAPPTNKLDSFISWIHFLLGCATLMPWNVLITATPYFLSRLIESPLKFTFSSYLSLTITGPSILFLAHATATDKQSDPARRILLSTLTLIFLIFLLTLSTYVHLPPGLFFAFVLLNAFAQSGAGSYLQTSAVGVASLFGPAAMQALMSGQAAVAVVVSGVQLASAVMSARDGAVAAADGGDGKAEETAAFLFFGLATLFMLFAAGTHAWVAKLPVYQAVVRPADRVAASAGPAEERQSLFSLSASKSADGKARIWRVARANVLYEVAVTYVFVVTLSVFPPITTSIQSTNHSMHPLLFSAIHFFVFNIGDFLGRFTCSFPQLLIWSARKLLALSAARTLFVPLFLMCNIQRGASPTSPPLPPRINSDAIFFLLLLALGWSNGYVSSLVMMSAPSLEHNPRLKGRKEDVDVAATVASFCLIGGLGIGSLASFAVRAMVCDCNPFRS